MAATLIVYGGGSKKKSRRALLSQNKVEDFFEDQDFLLFGIVQLQIGVKTFYENFQRFCKGGGG